MKRCPTCQSTYTDDSLDFCLQDGARLAPVSESTSSKSVNATWILPENPLSQRESPAPTKAADSRAAPTLQMPPTAQTVHDAARNTAREAHFAAPPQKTTNPLLIVGVTVIVILLLALVGIGIALLLRSPAEEQRGGTQTNNNTPNANSSTQTKESPSPANANNRNTASSSNTNDGTEAQTPLRISTNASSTRVPLKAFTYYASHVLDGNMQTAWIEGASGPGLGEWIQCDFDREVKLNQVQLTPGYFKNASIWKQNNRLAAATLQFSDGTSRRYTFPDQMQRQSLDTGGIRTRFVRLVIDEAYRGSVDYEDTAISEISFITEP
jgi:hypothetical protein